MKWHFAALQNQMRSIIPSLIVALKHLIIADQVNCDVRDIFTSINLSAGSVLFKSMD